MIGWISLHRKLTLSDSYFGQVFCRNMAWIDMLLIANYEDSSFEVHGMMIEVKRGELGYGILQLSKRWSWSESKVKRFLNRLKNEGQIEVKKTHPITLISICKYDDYQNPTDETTDKRSLNEVQTKSKRRHKNKNNKERDNMPDCKQVSEYFEENGYMPEAGERAFRYYDERGWKDSNDKPVRNWKTKMQNVWFTEENKMQEVKKSNLENNVW